MKCALLLDYSYGTAVVRTVFYFVQYDIWRLKAFVLCWNTLPPISSLHSGTWKWGSKTPCPSNARWKWEVQGLLNGGGHTFGSCFDSACWDVELGS